MTINCNCRQENVIREAKIKAKTEDKIYIELSFSQIKKGIAVHKTRIKRNPEGANYHK